MSPGPAPIPIDGLLFWTSYANVLINTSLGILVSRRIHNGHLHNSPIVVEMTIPSPQQTPLQQTPPQHVLLHYYTNIVKGTWETRGGVTSSKNPRWWTDK